MQPLSPSHQTHLDAYGEYLRQKTMTEKSRQRPLNLIRRYLHYLDEAYPGIAATRISYPQCCGFLQTPRGGLHRFRCGRYAVFYAPASQGRVRQNPGQRPGFWFGASARRLAVRRAV